MSKCQNAGSAGIFLIWTLFVHAAGYNEREKDVSAVRSFLHIWCDTLFSNELRGMIS